MKDSQKKQNIGFIVFFLIGLFAGAFLYNILEDPVMVYEEKIIYQEKEQPMLMVEYIDGGQNIDDESELIFSYWIYNFGNIEAKNVEVVCQILDSRDNIIKEEIYNIGNVASNSHGYEESYMDYVTSYDVFGLCKLKSANGDYINLYDRLDDLE